MAGLIYTSTTPRKKKPKPNAAQRQLQQEWEKLQASFASAPKFSKGGKPSTKASATPKTTTQAAQTRTTAPGAPQTAKAANYAPLVGAVGAKKDSKKYTGTECIGIAVMHKSSLAPVFSRESAIDVAKMRRG